MAGVKKQYLFENDSKNFIKTFYKTQILENTRNNSRLL